MTPLFIRARSIQRALGNPSETSLPHELRVGGSQPNEAHALLRASWVREGDGWSAHVELLQMSEGAQPVFVFPHAQG